MLNYDEGISQFSQKHTSYDGDVDLVQSETDSTLRELVKQLNLHLETIAGHIDHQAKQITELQERLNSPFRAFD